MKLRFKFPSITSVLPTVVVAFGAFYGSGLTAHAQDVPAQAALQETTANAPQAGTAPKRLLVSMTLRFVPAHLIAWQLDPQHAPQTYMALGHQATAGTSQENKSLLSTLPKDADWVWADDGTNQILLHGTPLWIAQRVVVAKRLDVKSPPITLNMRIVRINASERQTVRNVFTKPASVENINSLIAQGSATVQATSECTVSSNFVASLFTASTPIPPDIVALVPQGIRTNAYNITGTPTLNNDGTVTCVLDVSKSYELNATQRKFAVKTVAIVGDNDTIAISLDSHDLDGTEILLLTPHVLHLAPSSTTADEVGITPSVG